MTAKSPPCRARPIRKASNRQLGTDFDDFLREQGFYDEAHVIAVKRMLAFELGRGMVKVQLTRTTMAKRMGTTRVQLDRLLNPDGPATTLQPLARAAGAAGERAKISLFKA